MKDVSRSLTHEEKRNEKAVPFHLARIAAFLAFLASTVGTCNPNIYSPITPKQFLPGTFSQDVFSLAVSLLILGPVSSWMKRTGSIRSTVIILGLIDYLFYAYGIYTLQPICNELYLAYVAVFGTSLWSIVFFLAKGIDYEQLSKQQRIEVPLKAMSALLALLGILFPVLWISLLLPHMKMRTRPDAISIMAMDLSYCVPSLWISLWLLREGKRLGYVMAPAVILKAGVLGSSVLLGTVITPLYGIPISTEEVLTYVLLGPCSLVVAFQAIVSLPNDLRIY